MTNQSNPDKANLKGEDSSSPPAADSNKDRADAEKAPQFKNTYDQRKAALSKREIMEELSRQRFPWDD
jgi:hypothetical protein